MKIVKIGKKIWRIAIIRLANSPKFFYRHAKIFTVRYTYVHAEFVLVSDDYLQLVTVLVGYVMFMPVEPCYCYLHRYNNTSWRLGVNLIIDIIRCTSPNSSSPTSSLVTYWLLWFHHVITGKKFTQHLSHYLCWWRLRRYSNSI